MATTAGTATTMTASAVPAVVVVIVGKVTDILAGLARCHLGGGSEGGDSGEQGGDR